MTNRGFYFPQPLFTNTLGSIQIGDLFWLNLNFVAVVVVLALSLIAGRAYGKWAHAKQDATGEAQPIFWVRTAILLAPFAILMIVLFRLSRAQGLQLSGRRLRPRKPDRALAGALGLYRRLHRGKCALRHSGR